MQIREICSGDEDTGPVAVIVCRGEPQDIQMWLESAKTYGVYVIHCRSTQAQCLLIRYGE